MDGALFPAAVADGQWWRLVTAAFLHSGLSHVVFNMWALYAFGPQLEREGGLRCGHRGLTCDEGWGGSTLGGDHAPQAGVMFRSVDETAVAPVVERDPCRAGFVGAHPAGVEGLGTTATSGRSGGPHREIWHVDSLSIR